MYVGILLFLAALVFYYFSVCTMDYKKSTLLNLKPGPDAVEYFAQSVALAKGELPHIQIGRERLPSSFPPGYPALVVPWLKILSTQDAVFAPFRTNQTFGLLLLLAAFIFYLYLRMPLAGGVASLLLATFPGFWTFARSSMSDTTAWFFYILASMFAYLGLRQKIRWHIYASIVLLGLSMNIRLQSIFFAPLLLAMPLFPAEGNRWRWFYHCVAGAALFLLAASPYLLLNFVQLHSPFKMGGYFWYPARHLFSLAYIPTKNVAMFWQEFTLQPIGFYAANIFGSGTVFVPPFILLVLAGLAFVRFDRAAMVIGLTNLFFFALTATYLYPDGRYYLQFLLLLIPLAVLPVVWAANAVLMSRKCAAAIGLLGLFLATCLGYPSRSGYPGAGPHRSQAWDALYFNRGKGRSNWFRAGHNFVQRFGQDPAIVFSDIDPVYLNAIWPDSLRAAPVDENQRRRWSPFWHYGRPEAAALAQYAADRSLPVYAIVLLRKEKQNTISRLPQPAGFYWSEVFSETPGVVLKLVPVQS